MRPPTVLLTRPEAHSRRFADAFRARFGARYDIVIAPVLMIREVPTDLPQKPVAGVIFTSENGVRAARLPPRGLTAWCVGARTAAAAQAAGFRAISADGDAGALVSLLLREAPQGLLLHLRGAEARGEIAQRLQAAGMTCEERVVYEQVPLPLGNEARKLLAVPGTVLLPLFSPRSAALLAAEIVAPVARLLPVAISDATADAWRTLHVQDVTRAGRPDAEAMLDACESALAAAGAA